MFFSKESAFKTHLRRNINPKTWYYTSHNGATLVIQAWYALAAMQELQVSHRPGNRQKAWNISRNCEQHCFVFTSRHELVEAVDGKRILGSVAGSDHEFELFQQHFIVEPHALHVPNRKELQWISPPFPFLLGSITNPDHFMDVLSRAEGICAKAEHDFH